MRKALSFIVVLLAATLASSGAPPDRLPSLVAPAEARGLMMVGGGVPVASGPSAPELSDDFSGNLSKWTNTTNWSIVSGELVDGAAWLKICFGTALANSKRIAVKVKVVDTQYGSVGIILRAANVPGSGAAYEFSVNSDSSYIRWHDTDTSWDTESTIDNTFCEAAPTADGKYIGVEVYNIGNDTEVYVWIWDTDPGYWDAAHTLWGPASYSSLVNPLTNAKDTGTYVGLTATTNCKFDNFSAWSSAL